MAHKSQSRRKWKSQEHQRFTFVSCIVTLKALFIFILFFHHTKCLMFFFPSVVGRQKFVRNVLDAAPLNSGSVNDSRIEKLHFYKPAANNHMKVEPEPVPRALNHQATSPCFTLKKQKQESNSCDASRQSPPTKRLCSSAFTAEEMDLLNSY